MNALSDLFKILGDDTRLRIIHLLYHQDLCVCELVEIMEESQPKISKHIAKIRSQQMVDTNRNEQYIYYSLKRDDTELMSLLDPIVLSVRNKEPFSSDLNTLQSRTSFVCTRG